MAIRFRCVSCSEPIEVDDEWSTRLVACPYCRRTMTAPAESLLADFADIPVARPLPDATPQAPPATHGYPSPDTHAERNTPAVAALILSGVAILFFMSAAAVLGAHAEQLAEFRKAMEEGTGMMKAVNKLLEENQGMMPGWMLAVGMLEFAAFGALIASVVFGILGLRRPWRRGFAVTGLVVSGGFLIFFCFNAFGGIAAGLIPRH